MNTFRTGSLMALLIVLFSLVGEAIAGSQGLIIAFFVAVAMNFGSYWFSDKIVLRMYKATEVGPTESPELYEMVDRLRQRANLPMPKVYIIPSEQPNAFATGRNHANSAVAVTNGIVRLLSKEELEGVIGHELAHIKNRDILTSSVAATMASAITLLTRFAMFFGGGNRERNPMATLMMLFLAPLAAFLIQMAISRSREYVADRDGAIIADNPRALANALGRLQQGVKQTPMRANEATAHMFIMSPFLGSLGGLKSLFTTHPPADERIQRLLEMERTGF